MPMFLKLKSIRENLLPEKEFCIQNATLTPPTTVVSAKVILSTSVLEDDRLSRDFLEVSCGRFKTSQEGPIQKPALICFLAAAMTRIKEGQYRNLPLKRLSATSL
jgi:hypothetical protein